METIEISIEGMRVYAFHGVMEQERRVGNLFTVDVALTYPPALKAVQDDDVAHTLNYAELASAVQEVMAVPSQLIEHVAGRLRTAIMTRWPEVTGGRIRVRKPAPPIGGVSLDGASVTLRW